MLKLRNLMMLFSVVVMVATLAMVQGCSESESPVEPLTENLVENANQLNDSDSLVILGEDDVKGDVQSIAASACYWVSIPFYSQNDPSFKDEKLGYSGYWTIGNSGCYLTCVSMLYAKWGYYNMNPKTLNYWSYAGKSHYAFYDGTPYINPYKAIQYPGVSRNVRNISRTTNAVIYELSRGHPVLAKTNWYGGSHFVLIYGWDGYRFWVKDPVQDWPTQNQPVTASLSEVYYLKVLGY